MITHRPANRRGHCGHDLDTAAMGFRVLRVINEDRGLAAAAAAMILGLGALFTPGLAAAGDAAVDGRPQPQEEELLELINGERRARQLPPLTWNPVLAEMARLHAGEMRSMGRLSHQSAADGATYSVRLQRSPLAVDRAGENLAREVDIGSAHLALMESPGHRENILNADFTAVGIGVVPAASGTIFVVQDFAAVLRVLPAAAAAQEVAGALSYLRRRLGLEDLFENPEMSRRLRPQIHAMLKNDVAAATGLAVRGPAWAYAYTVNDPADLPAAVRQRVGQATSFGVAVIFGRTPSAPHGLYWVALVLGAAPGGPVRSPSP